MDPLGRPVHPVILSRESYRLTLTGRFFWPDW
jgi:hypothetical protein